VYTPSPEPQARGWPAIEVGPSVLDRFEDVVGLHGRGYDPEAGDLQRGAEVQGDTGAHDDEHGHAGRDSIEERGLVRDRQPETADVGDDERDGCRGECSNGLADVLGDGDGHALVEAAEGHPARRRGILVDEQYTFQCSMFPFVQAADTAVRVLLEESNDGATSEAAEIAEKLHDSAGRASGLGHNARGEIAPRPIPRATNTLNRVRIRVRLVPPARPMRRLAY